MKLSTKTLVLIFGHGPRDVLRTWLMRSDHREAIVTYRPAVRGSVVLTFWHVFAPGACVLRDA
jgi:hypothetical protein